MRVLARRKNSRRSYQLWPVVQQVLKLEGIVSKRALSPYKSGPSKFWLKTKNVVESELILLGTDYDNEGKPIAYLGREADGHLKFAGTAFVTLTDYKVYSYFAYTSRQLYIIDFVRQIPIS
jgi:hypothetical protein